MDNTGLVYLLNLTGQALEQANAEIARLAAQVAELERAHYDEAPPN